MSFRWASPLGISTALFLSWGLLWAVGLVGIFGLFWDGFPPWLLFSRDVDTQIFGQPPDAIRASEPAAAEAQWFLSHLLSMAVASAGVAITALAWFGLRRGERWALAALGGAALPLAVLFPYAVARYTARGVAIGWTDLQPFVTIPALLVPPAIVLGWWGLRQQRQGGPHP